MVIQNKALICALLVIMNSQYASNMQVVRIGLQTKVLPKSCIKMLWDMVFRLLWTLCVCESYRTEDTLKKK